MPRGVAMERVKRVMKMIYERHGKRLQFSGTNRGTYKWQLSQDNKKCHPLSNKLKKTHLKIWELP